MIGHGTPIGQRRLLAPESSSTEVLTHKQERTWDRFYRANGIEVKSGSGIGRGLG